MIVIKSKKILSLASVAVMLTSLVAVPVSAANVNQYEVSYETLTSAVTVGDTVIAPGTVAVTMSITGNTGFQYDTLALQLNENYEVLKTADGDPVLQTGEVLEDFHTAVEEFNNKICVAAAAKNESNKDGELFTVYCVKSSEISMFRTGELVKIVSPSVAPPVVHPMFSGAFYMIGDTDSDEFVNARDASRVYAAVSKYGGDIYREDAAYKNHVSTFFPDITPNDNEDNIPYYCAPDADVDTSITEVDAQAILHYAAVIGSGNVYHGSIGTFQKVIGQVS